MKISVIGVGAMGGATVEGLLKTTVIAPSDITVADPSQAAINRFAETGVSLTTDNQAAAAGADIVMVVVNPWLVEGVLTGLRDTLDYAQIVANEGYEVDVWANDTLVACVDENEASVFGYYVAA